MNHSRKFGSISRREFVASAAAALTSASALSAPMDRSRIGDAPVIFQRGFASVSYGQLHYRRAAPATLNAPLKRPVVCFHQSPNSSQVFIEFMAQMAQDRIVYAIDTPGFGESDLPPNKPTIRDYAAAMREFLERLALQDIDLVGYHTGASIAAELAHMAARRIHSLMLVGVALFNEEEKAELRARPWPKPVLEDGSHLIHEWDLSHRWRGTGQSTESVRRTFKQKIANGSEAWWGASAVFEHDLASAIGNVKQPMLVVRPNDDLVDITTRIADLRPDIEIIDYPTHGFGIFEVQALELATIARDFFDPLK